MALIGWSFSFWKMAEDVPWLAQAVCMSVMFLGAGAVLFYFPAFVMKRLENRDKEDAEWIEWRKESVLKIELELSKTKSPPGSDPGGLGGGAS